MLGNKKPLAAIIDISTNNLLSIKRAIEYIGFETKIIKEKCNIEKFDLIILPGVGAFGVAMKKLHENNLVNLIENALTKKNFLGICLGMQLLFEKSEEFGINKGIGFFKGEVKNFSKFNVEKETFLGWNFVSSNNKNINDKLNFLSEFYFVHSLFVDCSDKKDIIGISKNGNFKFCSAVKKDKVMAVQFHPEKSGLVGIEFLKKVKQMI